MPNAKIVTRGGRRAPMIAPSKATLLIIAEARAKLEAETAAIPVNRQGRKMVVGLSPALRRKMAKEAGDHA